MKRGTICCLGLALVVLVGCQGQGTGPGMSLSTETRQESWQSPFASGLAIRTKHYTIYTTAPSAMLKRYLPGFMEAAYRSYLELTQLPEPDEPQPMPFYMLGSRQEWSALTAKVTGPLAEKYLSIEAGGYCHQGVCVMWDIGPTASLSVAAHEGLHQFFHRRLKQRLPAWLEEGLCSAAEGYEISGEAVRFTPYRNNMRFNHLRHALAAGRWIALRDLLVMDSGDVATLPTERAVGYYGQLWALAVLLQSDGTYSQGLRRLLADAEAGKVHLSLGLTEEATEALMRTGRLYNRAVSEGVFRKYICDDLQAFEGLYLRFAERLAGL